MSTGPVLGWRVYYVGGEEYDDQWAGTPDDGVLAINVFHENATQTIYGYDWYFHVPDSNLFGGDHREDIAERYPGAIVKRGKWVPYSDWIEFQTYVKSDTYA